MMTKDRLNWDIDGFAQRIAGEIGETQAIWVEEILKSRIPKWQQWLLRKTNSRWLAKKLKYRVEGGWDSLGKKYVVSIWKGEEKLAEGVTSIVFEDSGQAQLRCLNCGGPLRLVKDKIANKVTGYLYRCKCMPPDMGLSRG